jgi:hypothetical protein
MATKRNTANTSRNGSRRRRIAVAPGLSVMTRPATNAARASGSPKATAPMPASDGSRDEHDPELQDRH